MVCRGCGDDDGPHWGYCTDCLESGEHDEDATVEG